MVGATSMGLAKEIYIQKYEISKDNDKPKDRSISNKKPSNDSNKQGNTKRYQHQKNKGSSKN
jgi:hypothetical protein